MKLERIHGVVVSTEVSTTSHSRASVALLERRAELNDSMIAKHPENLFSQ